MNPSLSYQLYRSEHGLSTVERLEVDRNMGELAAGLRRAVLRVRRPWPRLGGLGGLDGLVERRARARRPAAH